MAIKKSTPKKILDKLPFPISGRTKGYTDTSFVTGDSPVTLDVNADLGRNAITGFISNDGDGDIKVEITDDGTTFGTQITIEDGEVLILANLDVDQIKLTWVSDSSYRIFVA